MKLVVFRPEGAQDLAQGKAYSPPPWDLTHMNHLAALKCGDCYVPSISTERFIPTG